MRTVGTLKRLLVGVAIALPTALALFAAGSLVASHAAQAAAVTPIPVPGAANTTCSQLAQDHTAPPRAWSELKFEGGNLPSVGNSQTLTSGDNYLTATITRTGVDEWSWTSNTGVDGVFVKDGVSGSNLYLYDADPNGGGDEAMSDSGLVVPGTQGTSHVSFCYDVEANPAPASLTVIKHVINDDGGTATADDWTIHVDGPTTLSFPGAEAPGTTSFVAEGNYTITESGGPPGYTLTYSGWCSASGTSHLPSGHSYTCTLTNDDNPVSPATLSVKKVVINDNGGTKGPSDFSFSVNGGTAQPFEADGQNDLSVPAGTYNVTEPASAGYTTTYDGCSNIQLAAGGSALCTVTNNDTPVPPATVIVRKVMVGGTGSFTLSGTPSGTISENLGTISASVAPGTYTSTEAANAGWDLTSILCDSAGSSANLTARTATFNVASGDVVTCTFTNVKRSSLIVKKIVVNDNGGTKVASNFGFSVNGAAAQPFEADGQNDLAVAPGIYAVTEPASAGYTTTYDGCSNIQLPPGGTATCTITNNDVATGVGSMSISKSANPVSLKEPGGQVTYSVTITNTSVDVDISVTNVVDDRFGDLDDEGGNGCFDVPINMAPGAHASCTFTTSITGAAGTSHVNTVTASGHDENGHPLSASANARVDITPKLIDLVIVKDATSPTALNGTVTYSLTVTNKGPDTATGVQVADPAPAGITYQSATASQGSCSVAPAIVTCDLGTLGVGQSATITVVGKATQVGQHTNTATVTGSGGRETNPADNVDSATTVVPAPAKPPTVTPKPKPKPKPKPEVCLTLTVSPKMIKADGKPDRVVVKVTAAGKNVKGAKVVASGTGVRQSGTTNGQGVAVVQVNSKKPGLITITAAEKQQHACGSKRIGVVGVFLPPLTG